MAFFSVFYFLLSTANALHLVSPKDTSVLHRRAGDDFLTTALNDPGQWLPDVQLQDIRCDGPLPDFPVPGISARNTLQQLCASPLVGRRRSDTTPQPRGGFLNGFCAQSRTAGALSNIRSNPTFFQDFIDDPNIYRYQAPHFMPGVQFGERSSLNNARLYLYCRDRCYCNVTVANQRQADHQVRASGVRILTSKPRGYPDHDETIINIREWLSDQIALDRPSGTERRAYSSLADPPKYYTMYTKDGQERYASLVKENLIKCRDVDFPDIPYPPPYDTEPPQSPRSRSSAFPTVLSLCAVALSGGNPGANAGGYCHRSNHRYLKPRVTFSDEMTPRVEWTFGANPRFSCLLRHFCDQQCWCASGTEQDRERSGISSIGSVAVIISRNGDMEMVGPPNAEMAESSASNYRVEVPGLTDEDLKHMLYPIAPKARLDGGKQQCIVDEVDYCAVKPRPADVGRPMPGLIAPYFLGDDLAMCGQSCDGPASQTCEGYSGSSSSCRCMVVSSLTARKLGFDSVAPPALCIDIDSFGRHHAGSRAGLGKRIADEALGMACPCNSTYASQSCCSSDSGLVWEPERMRITWTGSH